MSGRRSKEKTRQAYVSLIQDLQNDREELIDPSSKTLLSYFKKTNELYENVNSAREQALDSQALSLISGAGVDKLERFRTDFTEKHEPIQFVNKVKEWLGTDSSAADEEDEFGTQAAMEINWSDLGQRALPFIKQTPTIDFMYGLMDVPEKAKKKATRKQKEKAGPLLVAKEGIDTANQVGKETTKNIEQLYTSIKGEKKKRPLYDTLINPKDFGQTIENFFYLSFLVKDGHVKISSGDEPGIEPAEQPSKEDYIDGKADKKQCVVRLDYRDWERISSEKHLTKSYMPERDYSSFAEEAEKRRKRISELPELSSDEEFSQDELEIPATTGKRQRPSQSSQEDVPKKKKQKTK